MRETDFGEAWFISVLARLLPRRVWRHFVKIKAQVKETLRREHFPPDWTPSWIRVTLEEKWKLQRFLFPFHLIGVWVVILENLSAPREPLQIKHQAEEMFLFLEGADSSELKWVLGISRPPYLISSSHRWILWSSGEESRLCAPLTGRAEGRFWKGTFKYRQWKVNVPALLQLEKCDYRGL